MLVSTNTHHPEGQGVVRGQSVTYFASAACSGGILAGGGPFLGGSCRLSGVSLNCTGKVVACIMTYVYNAATWRTLNCLYTKYDTEAMVTTYTQSVWCNSTHTEWSAETCQHTALLQVTIMCLPPSKWKKCSCLPSSFPSEIVVHPFALSSSSAGRLPPSPPAPLLVSFGVVSRSQPVRTVS